MYEQRVYVIELRTSKGEFFYNGNSKHDHQRIMGVDRTFGWVNDAKAAQHYRRESAALKQAMSLHVDLRRLFECDMLVRRVTLRYEATSKPAMIIIEDGRQP